MDLQNPRQLSLQLLQRRALAHHLGEIRAAAARPGATKLAQYVGVILGDRLPTPEEYAPAAYIRAVRQQARRVALAQLRTGSHWLGEETARVPPLPGRGGRRAPCSL